MKSFLLLRRQMTHSHYIFNSRTYLHWLTLVTWLTHVPWWVLQGKAGTLMVWHFYFWFWKISTSNLLINSFFPLHPKTQTYKSAVSFQLTSWTGGETRMDSSAAPIFNQRGENSPFSEAHARSPGVGCCTSVILRVKKGQFHDWRATLIFGRRRRMCSVFKTPAGNYRRTIKWSWTN